MRQHKFEQLQITAQQANMQQQSPPHLGPPGWSLEVFWLWLNSQKSCWSPNTLKQERAATVVRRPHPRWQTKDKNVLYHKNVKKWYESQCFCSFENNIRQLGFV